MTQTAFSDHAIDRWTQRFADADVLDAFARSYPVPCHLLYMEAKRTGRPVRFSPDAEHRRDDETGAVFVLRPDRRLPGSWTVVTVVKFSKPKVCKPPALQPRGRKR
jgi:hypothetical protein